MKKQILLFLFLFISVMMQALTVASTAGGLSSAITTAGGSLSTEINLTVTGTIDARDFLSMRDNMPLLTTIDLSGANIASYTGTGGTGSTSSTTYYENTIPDLAFFYINHGVGGNLSSVILPITLTSIGMGAFYGCNKLTSINISASITTIGVGAFSGSSCLILVDVNNSSYSSIDGVLFDKTKTTLIHYPTSKSGTYTIPATVTSIAFKAFFNCISLTSIDIPALVTSIGVGTFSGCKSLTSVIIPASISSIENFTFSDCVGLKSVTISSSVTSIGDNSFSGCVGLTLFTIPPSVSSIGNNAFDGCSGLTTVNYNATNCLQMGDPNHPPTVFFNCNALSTLNIGNNVTTIPNMAFYGCKGLTTVTIPTSVTSIGGLVFCYCTSLTTVTIPSSVKSLGQGLFKYCSSLTSITIQASVTYIGDVVFEGCTSLSSIFAYSTIPVDLASRYDVFASINKTTCILHVPVGSKEAYQGAVQWKDFKNIVEDLSAGVNNLTANSIKISTHNRQIKLTDAPLNETLSVYNMQGTAVYGQQINASDVTISLPTNGVYLVRVGSQNMKVLIK